MPQPAANPLYDQLFGRHAGRTTPFLYLRDGSVLSHAALLGQAARMAHALRAAGLTPGDRVVAQVEKSPSALALYAACVQAGFIFLPLNTAYTVEEVRYFLDDCEAGAVICDPRAEAALSPHADRLRAPLFTLDADGLGSLTDASAVEADTFPTVARGEDDLAALLYTSGTTGRSKGAMLSQRNLLSNAQVLAEFWHFTAADVLLHALPIFHTHGLFVATNITLLAGGTMVFLPRFDLDALLDWMPKSTAMMGVPTFYTRLLDDPRFTRDVAAGMRLFISGSAPLRAETHDAFAARTGHAILERYGMTETNMSTSNPYDGARRAGTVGLPLPGVDLRIVDPTKGAALPNGTVGQIEVRGPNVFQGYWRMPEKTAAEFRSDGFFQTGDLGLIDGDGYVQIVGRSKDLIISGGFNVYPKEVEQVLDAQPGVLESAVIGVPHADFGETALALLVPEPGRPPDLGAIEAAVAAALARFKHPRKLVLVDALPRNAMGKVQKADLRAQYAETFAEAGQ